MLMIVWSDASDSASFVIARCRRSWKQQAHKRRGCAFPSDGSGMQSTRGIQGTSSGLAPSNAGRFVHQGTPRGTPSLLWPGRIVSCPVAGRLRLPVQKPGKEKMVGLGRSQGICAFQQSGKAPRSTVIERDLTDAASVPLRPLDGHLTVHQIDVPKPKALDLASPRRRVRRDHCSVEGCFPPRF